MIIAGYASHRHLPAVTEDAAKKLTHLNIAFGHVKEGIIVTDHLEHIDRLAKLRKYNPELQILLSIGGWSAGGFSEAAATKEGREQLAQSAVAALKRYDLDGIDLDWEYPCYAVAGIGASPEDKGNFTALLAEMRRVLDKQGGKDDRHYSLTIAAGADQYYIDGTEMEKVIQHLDFVMLMTYDMRGGFQTLTGHHTNLFASTGDLFRISVDASVKLFREAGVPKEKIVIGCAFYSRVWKDVPDNNNGLHQMTASFGGGGPSYSQLASEYIGKNGYTRHWDDEAQAPYLFNGNTFITYDDEQSLACKSRYVKEQGLAGAMFWEYGCDTSGTLLNALYNGLHN
ncbi:glycoside hydrolase family 18 protein [Paenibacillus sp. J5C_2022]|uniref:glycoside hydrolase family 18 protein n=1 Tax=Paenibacillus sp. J5C2022 TaxID=2977129 RepID=UPI0021CFC007|nr:glycoside hydrolase family 18 protein [Paenibacillus sp. J5C2022]MCU6712334.1 glycoside hydrolase family 18 protein [Paenibacillus sp. J5C2022]